MTVWGPAATGRLLEVVTSAPVAVGPTTTIPLPLGVPEIAIASVPVALLVGHEPPPVRAARAAVPAAAATNGRQKTNRAEADPSE